MKPRTPRLAVSNTGVGVWVASGEIDASTAASVTDSMLPTDAEIVTLDMSAVTFVDSSGLRMLIEVQRQLGDHQRLVLRAPRAGFVRLLEIAGLRDHLSIEP